MMALGKQPCTKVYKSSSSTLGKFVPLSPLILNLPLLLEVFTLASGENHKGQAAEVLVSDWLSWLC